MIRSKPRHAFQRWLGSFLLTAFALAAVFSATSGWRANAAQSASNVLLPISIDYPEDESIFPPGITPPTFLWRDAAGSSWSIDISFADNSAPIHAGSAGERMQIGPIDPDCVSSTNQPPKLTPQQAATWTWKPDPATWAVIQEHSVEKPATLTITVYRDGHVTFSQARIHFTTSKDEVADGDWKGVVELLDVPRLVPQRTVQQCQNLGVAYAKQRKFDESIRILRDGLNTYPDSLPLADQLADALSRSGKKDEADAVLQIARARRHGNADTQPH